MSVPSHVIAYDFGTGGTKASLYDTDGACLAAHFCPCETFYPRAGRHEQRPADWWDSVVGSTHQLMDDSDVDPGSIVAAGISGHSLGVVPLDEDGTLLREQVPIWSDSRPDTQPAAFFREVTEEQWYLTTGNGFPAPLYAVFKIMWLRDNEPALFDKTRTVLGTKDYVNYLMTGVRATDHSYASGSGVYDLAGRRYAGKLIAASGLHASLFPEIVPSTRVLGTLLPAAAEQLGLPETVRVVAGGVDNACMALGARAVDEGDCYTSMGSSSWIAVTSAEPVLDPRSRPYVFAHVVPEKFTSAIGVFSTGSSFRWVREQLCRDLEGAAAAGDADTYELMLRSAAASPPGARGALFLPSLAGGSSLDGSPNVRGAFANLDIGHTRADLIRAAMEGISMSLALALDALAGITCLSDEMIAVGGGSRSDDWMRIYADLYGKKMVRTNVGQQAAALGAAALALVGIGAWDDFSKIKQVHRVRDVTEPDAARRETYAKIMPVFKRLGEHLAEIGDMASAADVDTQDQST